MPAIDDDLDLPGTKRKQTSFDITNYPPAQKGPARVSAAVQPIPGDPARAQRMQAQYDQPVTRGVPMIAAGMDGVTAPQVRQASLSVASAPAGQILPRPAGTGAVDMPAIGRGIDESADGWARTGTGSGRTGGEIVGRRSVSGAMEFTNNTATPGSVASAWPMPAGGMGSIGDGIGTFSQGESGDAARAYQSFERANEIRAQNIASRPRELGDAGGRMTIVRDSSRAPSLEELMNARLEGHQANTEAQRQQTRQSILSGMDGRLTGQLQRQLLGQEIRAGELNNKRQTALSGILAGLDDPQLQGVARTQAERRYLMQADPKAFLSASANGDGLKLTEQQSKDLVYYARANEANAQLARQGDALTGRATGERGQLRGLADTILRGTPWIGDSSLANSMVSTERQRAEQAGREVLAAILRKDTGAAITQREMEIYGAMYLPQPGDGDEVLNQKAEARTRALESIRDGLGTAERKAAPLRDGRRQAGDAPRLDDPIRVSSRDQVDALPSGTIFMGPDGVARRKP